MPEYNVRIENENGEQIYTQDVQLSSYERAEEFAQAIATAQPPSNGDCDWQVSSNDASIYKDEKKS